jgi:hypothetical protein
MIAPMALPKRTPVSPPRIRPARVKPTTVRGGRITR